MKQFEYQSIGCPDIKEIIDDVLKREGANGWELVQIKQEDNFQVILFLKREI
jgi:hypothetical protein